MKKILLIEDDELLRETTADFLSEEGFEVFKAEDGMLGIKSAIKHLPDLILCDIEMPSFNGYEVYSILQENTETRLVPFIFLTARAESEDIRDGMMSGVDDYITKPFDYDELLQSINIRIAKRERLIKSTSEIYKVLFENSLTGVFVITGRKFAYTNKKFSEIIGYTAEELNSFNWLNLMIAEDKKRILSKLKAGFLGIQKTIHTSFKAFSKKRKLLELNVSTGITIYKGKSSLIGNIIVHEKNSNSKEINWDSITAHDLERFIEILEEKQELLSHSSVEKLKNVISKETTDETIFENKEELTDRELEVLDLFCKGFDKHEIGEMLFISVRTVERHRASLIEKTGTNNTVGLVLYALKHKLINFKADN